MKRIFAISVAVLMSFSMLAQNQPVKTYKIKSKYGGIIMVIGNAKKRM